MLSTDRRLQSQTDQLPKQEAGTGSTDPLEPIGQVPEDAVASSGDWSAVPQYDFPGMGGVPGGRTTDHGAPADEVTQQTALTTNQLPDRSSTPGLSSGPPALMRKPVVIKGAGLRGAARAPLTVRKGSIVVHIVIAAILITILGGTLASFASVDRNGQASSPLLQPLIDLVTSGGNSASDIASLEATATPEPTPTPEPTMAPIIEDPVVIEDPTNSGGISNAPSDGNLDRFSYGYCTYWANMRYHELTGMWVPWLGDAYMWSYQASAYNWVVSDTPIVPSIIVLQPGVQGAGDLGHVAIVESINPDGSVNTSNYNWNAGWNVYQMVVFQQGAGTKFVWHPDAG